MNEFQNIDIQIDSEYASCPSVCDFPVVQEDQIVGGNLKITDLDKIQIRFDYPLSHQVTLAFSNPDGFTRMDFFRAVYDGYVTIYAAETAVAGNPGLIPGMLNRNTSKGPYGIWGHCMEDLFLEGFREIDPGVFELTIGS